MTEIILNLALSHASGERSSGGDMRPGGYLCLRVVVIVGYWPSQD